MPPALLSCGLLSALVEIRAFLCLSDRRVWPYRRRVALPTGPLQVSRDQCHRRSGPRKHGRQPSRGARDAETREAGSLARGHTASRSQVQAGVRVS